MKIDSCPAKQDPFQKIEITIIVESDREATALRYLCESPSIAIGGKYTKECQDFLFQLRPHVTPA